MFTPKMKIEITNTG